MVLDDPAQATRRRQLPDLADLETRIAAFIAEWNEIAHPFEWTPASFEKVLAKVEQYLKAA